MVAADPLPRSKLMCCSSPSLPRQCRTLPCSFSPSPANSSKLRESPLQLIHPSRKLVLQRSPDAHLLMNSRSLSAASAQSRTLARRAFFSGACGSRNGHGHACRGADILPLTCAPLSPNQQKIRGAYLSISLSRAVLPDPGCTVSGLNGRCMAQSSM